MASEANLQQKKEAVEALVAKLKDAEAGVLVDYIGINVADDTKLRRSLREAGVEYSVVKNSILSFAFKEAGYEELNGVLSGSTALAISKDDPIVAAKILGKYAEGSKGKFTVKAGFMEGKAMSADEVMKLSKLPGREGLLTMLVCALTGTIRGLAVALNAIAEKDGGEAA